MVHLKRLSAALLLGALVGGCGGDTAAPPAPRSALTGPFPVTLPAPGDNLSDGEEFEVCKVGSSASFSYSVRDLQTGTVTNSTISLAAGECQVIAFKGGVGQIITITETAAQAGYQLSRVDVISVKGTTPVYTTRTSTGPTVVDTIGGAPTGFRGSLVRFFNEAIPAGTIGDFVWDDFNGNGVQDLGEPGIPGLTVTLGGAASGTTTTDANGGYLFTGLAAGSYTVTVGTPAGYTPSPSNQGGDPNKDSNGSPASVTLATNTSSDLSIDFGFVLIPTGQLGDFVWDDLNGNGIQDNGEPGIAGLTVTLGGAASGTTTTDANGGYLFTGLSAGSYTVTVATPAGYSASPSNQGGDPNKDSNGSPASVTLSTSVSSDLSIDFGFVKIPTGQLGDFVWNDLNGNGVQDLGEPGIAGLTVTLGGAASATTTTDANGGYLFSGLSAGSYTVTVATPAGYTASPSFQGGNPNKDSNGSPAAVTLATNASVDLSIDFGFVRIPTGQLGDFVWDDLNGNGIQDSGEPGIAGLTVTLGGAASATTTTNASGGYLFSGLSAGTYTVTVGTPAGYTASPSNQGGNPNKDSNGSPATVTLATSSSVDLSIDFGYVRIPTGRIGDFIWKDTNGDGMQNVGEPGFAGLTVTLTGPVNATTTTDASGNYLFTGLPAGTYTVSVATPSGYTATLPNQGSDPNKDSNGSPATVTLPTSSSVDLSIDFGFQVVVPPPTGGQGCTPGYWKQSQHFDSWPAPYAPNQLFSSVFKDAFPGKTLVQVLGLGGGGLNALGRHTVAALLNGALNSGVRANLTAQQVINSFNSVFPGGDYESQKNIFAGFNEQGCPLN